MKGVSLALCVIGLLIVSISSTYARIEGVVAIWLFDEGNGDKTRDYANGYVGVSVCREDNHICDVSTVDKVSVGSMLAEIEYAKDTWTEEILHDPFTGRLRQD